MQQRCGGEGGEAEAGFGGVLEVGAGVREEDEGHGWLRVVRSERAGGRGRCGACCFDLIWGDRGGGRWRVVAKEGVECVLEW